MHLDREWILSVIPHQGTMCLLDEVLEWNAERIVCRSGSHRAADNPLLAHGRLGSACGIEYAAQAMAVHGALLGGSGPRPVAGYLAGLRSVRLLVRRLDDISDELLCSAVRIAGDGSGALYEFDLRAGSTLLLSGRATVVLDAGKITTP